MIKQFLSQLGKPKEIAAAITTMSGQKCTVGSVYQWPYENEIPQRWRYYVAKLAKSKKAKNIPPEIKRYAQ